MMKYWLFDVSADGGRTWTTQWLTIHEAQQEIKCGNLVSRKEHLLTPHITHREA